MPKAFVSSAKLVRPQHKNCSSLAIKMFVSIVIRNWRWVAKTIYLVASDECVRLKSEIIYSEVCSRDYLVTSGKRVRLLFGSWFRTPQKGQKLGEKACEKNSFQVRNGPVERTEQGREEKTQEHNPTMEWWRPPHWPPTQCISIPSSPCLQNWFFANKVN